MAITDVTLTQEGTGLSGSGISIEKARRSYTAHYRVTTDNPTTSPKAVEAYFRATKTLPYYGRKWSWSGENGAANDKDVDAVCNKLDVSYQPKSGGLFTVEAGFEPESSDSRQQQGKDGMSDDPADWMETINIGYTQISVPVEKSVFEGFNPPNIVNPKLIVGQEFPPCSSAMVPYDPPPEKQIHIKVVRLGKWVSDLNDIDPWQGVINDRDFTIDKMQSYNFKQVVPKWHGLIKHIGGHHEWINDDDWYRREIELWINPLGWVEEYLDKGLHRRAMAGDPKRNGTNETLSLTDINPGDPISEQLTDNKGYTLTSPVLLDGNGQPLQDLKNPVWLKWRHLPQKDLGVFNW
jgi:hypothetical protein